MTIQAYATAPGYAASALASGYYSITTVPPGFTGITALYGGVMQFSGTGGVVQAYVLSGTANLAPASWMPIVTNIADTNGMVIFTDSQATNYGQRYYRLSTP
jgi:hypothetical protein